jgi:alkyldihydroxyacetonephosphate synthase
MIHVILRISQVYHEGVCIYLYFGINRCNDQLKTFEHLASILKDTVNKSGGSLSHHHGIGKKNALKYGKFVSNVSKKMLMSLKKRVDPKNIFAAGNLGLNFDEDHEILSKL